MILKRQSKKRYDSNRWEFISSFLKNRSSIRQQAKEQVKYETGLDVRFIKEGKLFEVADEYGKWLIHPFLFTSQSDSVKLRAEDHTSYKWIKKSELSKFNCVKDLEKNLTALRVD